MGERRRHREPTGQYGYDQHEAGLGAGVRVRLKHDPGRIGILTGKTREYGGLPRWQVTFAEGVHYVPEDQLEEVADGGTTQWTYLNATDSRMAWCYAGPSRTRV